MGNNHQASRYLLICSVAYIVAWGYPNFVWLELIEAHRERRH